MSPMSRRLFSSRAFWLSLGLCAGPGLACSGPPSVPAHPTWADVAPLVHGECTHCHGSTAFTTGGGYRLDFFDMTSDVCGDAAKAIPPASILASTSAILMAADLTPPAGGGRPRMPPAPAPLLQDWERETIVRWAMQPAKGAPPATNRPPTIDIAHVPVTADQRLTFTAVLDDPDADPIVGVIEAMGADTLFAMNRAGAFTVDLDTSAWPAGARRLSAVLCDGWTKATYDLGSVTIEH
jgi:hypothetical protein